MGKITLVGGMAMAAHTLGYGHRVSNGADVKENGKPAGSMMYEIDETDPAMELIRLQAQEWRKKGNANMKANNAKRRKGEAVQAPPPVQIATMDDRLSLIEKALSLLLHREQSPAQPALPGVEIPEPIPEPIPESPPEPDYAPVKSLWRTRSFNEGHGVRIAEVMERDGHSLRMRFLGGGLRCIRQGEVQEGTLKSHWTRIDTIPSE